MRESRDRREGLRIDAKGIRAPAAYAVEPQPAGAGVTLLELRGELDMAAAPELSARIEAGGGTVVLDLAETTFVDSAVLHVLLRARTEPGARLVLAAVPPPIRRLLDLTGTSDLFAQAPDAAAALKLLRG